MYPPGHRPASLADAVPSSTQEPAAALAALLQKTMDKGASELHLQVGGQQGQVRFRVDGIMLPGPDVSRAAVQAMRQTLLQMAGLDPHRLDRPQHGHCSTLVGEHPLRVQLDMLPDGQDICLCVRLSAPLPSGALQQLNLDEDSLQALGALLHSGGLVLCAGPAGSGKRTLLYALLQAQSQPGLNILTLEDGIKQPLPGIGQTDLRTLPTPDMASLIPALLRQNPDLLMLSDLPDADSARQALRAAQSGRTVLVGQYASDANTAIRHLLEFGISQNQLADVLSGIVILRLPRRLCDACAEPVTAPDALEALFQSALDALPARRAHGCPLCHHTGYRGRLPLLEVHAVDQSERHLLRQNRYLIEAERNPHRSLDASATAAILDGLTSIHEITRVLGSLYWQTINPFACAEALRLHAKQASP